MPRSLALAAAIATALTVAACGTAPLAQQAPDDGAASRSAESAPMAEPLQADDAPAEEPGQAAESGQSGSGQAGSGQAGAEQPDGREAESRQADAGQADAGQAEAEAGAESSELEASALGSDAALRVSAGEPGLPVGSGASIDDVLRLGAVATWIDAPRVLAISLPATEQCWPTALAPVVESSTRMTVEFAGAEECGEPDGARTYTVQVPDGIEVLAVLEVALEGLEYDFTLVLPAR